MSKNYNHEIGYETLLADFKRYQKQTPRGVGLTQKGNTIALQFKVGNISIPFLRSLPWSEKLLITDVTQKLSY